MFNFILRFFMKFVKLVSLMALLAFTFSTFTFAEDAPKVDAKKLFVDKKCNSCHSVESAGITKTNANSKAPDLSNGAKYTKDFLAKYLKKEEAIEGKKHGIAFKATDVEFTAMVNWLSEQVPPKK